MGIFPSGTRARTTVSAHLVFRLSLNVGQLLGSQKWMKSKMRSNRGTLLSNVRQLSERMSRRDRNWAKLRAAK